MKLKQLLLISLAIVPLFSCGGSKNPVDPVIDYTVTEGEFNRAVSFAGVNYIQINTEITNIDEIGIKHQEKSKCAPDAYSVIIINKDGLYSSYDEQRIFRIKDGGDYLYWGYSNINLVIPKWETMGEELAKGNFKIPTDFNLLPMIKDMGGDYHSFTIKDNFYYARFEEKQVFTDLYFRFENKILTSFKQVKHIKEDMTEVYFSETDVTYEKEGIIEPFVPSTAKIVII